MYTFEEEEGEEDRKMKRASFILANVEALRRQAQAS